MRRSTRPLRCGRRVIAVLLAGAVVISSPALANAGHNNGAHGDPENVGALVAEVAEANQRLQDAGAAIQAKQEGVNKALVDVVNARDAAEVARADVQKNEQALAEANTAVAAAQQRFDRFAASTYINGPSNSSLTAGSPEDVIATASAGQTLSLSYQQTLADLQRARTEQANKESLARAAQQKADQAAGEAQRSFDAAVAALRDAQQQFGTQQADVDRLVGERDAAQARLSAARPAPAAPTAPPAAGDRWDRQAPPAAATPGSGQPWDQHTSPPPPATGGGGQWDTTLPQVPSANVVGDPIAIVNAVLKIAATSAQVTADMGRNFLVKLGLVPAASAAADPGITNGRIPRVSGRQAMELVIRRAMSQLGVPYSWGGGNAAGPSRGIDQGANTVGFDCSGLYLYAFAGVGIKLDHYSGSQYNAGRKIPSSQMRRGDLIFYGPNASQHEAMYLGDGTMLEAPYTGSQVRIAPVRTSGMMPYVTRLIEW